MKELPSISFFNQALSVREQAKLRRNYRQILEYIVECRGSFGLWIENLCRYSCIFTSIWATIYDERLSIVSLYCYLNVCYSSVPRMET